MSKNVTINTNHLPVIALVGRVNVGKSTLFNRLIEESKAIVSDRPGTTRTSNEGVVRWRGKAIKLIDTGGLTFKEKMPLEADILRQGEQAMKQADIVMLVVDAKDGVLPQEKELAKRLRRIVTKPVLLVANKVDKQKEEDELASAEFHKLGLGQPWPISAASGRNVGDLLDHIFSLLSSGRVQPKNISAEIKPIRVSLIGKPNVGKSSLFNKLIGEDKVIVSDLPHTTREPHDTLVAYESQPILFIDTAGIRRKGKVEGELERAGIQKSLRAVANSDIVLFVIDGNEPIAQQDSQLGGMIERRGKSVIILINKCDLAGHKSEAQQHAVTKMVYSYFPHLDFAPLIAVSGKTGYRVHRIFPLIIEAWQARQIVVPGPALELFLKQATRAHRPARGKGTRHPKILGLRQLDTNPPVFELLIKQKTSLHRSYVNYLERKLREQFAFFATPLIMKLSKVKR